MSKKYIKRYTINVVWYIEANQWGEFKNIIGIETSEQLLLNVEIQVKPNPVETYFAINGLYGTAFMRLFDSNGRCLLSGQVHDSEKIDVSGLVQGLYFIELKKGKEYL